MHGHPQSNITINRQSSFFSQQECAGCALCAVLLWQQQLARGHGARPAPPHHRPCYYMLWRSTVDTCRQ
jgi:hypothetical protein